MSVPITLSTAGLQDQLDRCMPAAKEAGMGTLLFNLVRGHNAMIALLAGAGIAGVNATTLPAPLVLPGS
jgi:hypothetical protein